MFGLLGKLKKERRETIGDLIAQAERNERYIHSAPLLKSGLFSGVMVGLASLVFVSIVFGGMQNKVYRRAAENAKREVKQLRVFEKYKKVISKVKRAEESEPSLGETNRVFAESEEPGDEYFFTSLIQAKRRYALAAAVLSERLKLAQLVAQLRKMEDKTGMPVDAYLAKMSLVWKRGGPEKTYLVSVDAKKVLANELRNELERMKRNMTRQQQFKFIALEKKLNRMERLIEELKRERSQQEPSAVAGEKRVQQVKKCRECRAEALTALNGDVRIKVGKEWLVPGAGTSDGCCILQGVEIRDDGIVLRWLKLSEEGQYVEKVESVKM